MKKTDPTEEERKQKQIEELRRQAEQKRKEEEERKNKLNSLNKQPFDNGRSGIEIRTGLDAYDIAELLNKVGYRYGSQRQERARAWEGYGVSRIYFGRDYVTIKDGVITNRDLRKVRACTACDDAMNAINAVLGNDSTDRVRSTRAEESEAIEAQCNQYEHVPGCPNTNGVIPKNKKKRKNRKIGHIDKKRVTKIGTFPKLAQFGIKQGEVSITGNGVKKGIINKRWTENNYVSKLALSLQEARFARIEPNKKHPTKQVVLVFCVMQYDGITHYNKVVIDQKTGKVNSMHDIGKAAFIKEKGQSIR